MKKSSSFKKCVLLPLDMYIANCRQNITDVRSPINPSREKYSMALTRPLPLGKYNDKEILKKTTEHDEISTENRMKMYDEWFARKKQHRQSRGEQFAKMMPEIRHDTPPILQSEIAFDQQPQYYGNASLTQDDDIKIPVEEETMEDFLRQPDSEHETGDEEYDRIPVFKTPSAPDNLLYSFNNERDSRKRRRSTGEPRTTRRREVSRDSSPLLTKKRQDQSRGRTNKTSRIKARNMKSGRQGKQSLVVRTPPKTRSRSAVVWHSRS